MKQQPSSPRTLAMYVSRRGIAFALFIHPSMILDWGTREIRSKGAAKHTDTLRIAKLLIDQLRPEVLVIEDVTERNCRRAPRIRRLYRAIAQHAERKKIDMDAYSRRDMKEVFRAVGASNKHELNCAVVHILPALETIQPPMRKFYDPEAAVQGIFDAAALGITFFAQTKRLKLEAAIPPVQADEQQ